MFEIKQVPNIISIFRILISCALLVVKSNVILFTITYILCGVSDVLDGYIARRFKWESRAGAKLDSVSDFVFYGIVFYLMLFTTNISHQLWVVIGLVVVLILRTINFLITKIKFNEWGMLHSYGNKTAGLLLFFYIPVVLISGDMSLVPGLILFLVASLSAIEETVILISSEKYDVNRKSILMK